MVDHMDNALLPYLTAKNEREREQHLDELLTRHAAPLIRQVLRRKFGFYVNGQGINKNNQDAEDLYQEAITRVVQLLSQLQASSSPTKIENFKAYVSRVTSNICIDFIRDKSPARSRLNTSVRDILRRHDDLVTWVHNNETLCGFATWRNTGKSSFSDQESRDIETKLETFKSARFPDEDVRLAPLSQIVAELFDWIGGPIEVDLLVRMVGYLLTIKDDRIESLTEQAAARWEAHLSVNTQSGEFHVEANELLARLWRAVTQLPAQQRDAFAFRFEDAAGQDFFTVLLAAGIVNWDELAKGMGRSVEEVGRLSTRMPMDGAAAADELGVSRKNVWKWRFRAIQRLKIELNIKK
jgi:RNA polymerase sigma factor (sigma-70 family)